MKVIKVLIKKIMIINEMQLEMKKMRRKCSREFLGLLSKSKMRARTRSSRQRSHTETGSFNGKQRGTMMKEQDPRKGLQILGGAKIYTVGTLRGKGYSRVATSKATRISYLTILEIQRRRRLWRRLTP